MSDDEFNLRIECLLAQLEDQLDIGERILKQLAEELNIKIDL